jgi:hypothetical protein
VHLERRVHLVRVVGPVREDVPDLDAADDAQLPVLAPGADVTLTNVVHVDRLAVEVTAADDASEVGVLLVGAGDVRTLVDRRVDHGPHAQTDRSDISRHRASGGEVGIVRELDLARAEQLAELRFVDVPVARQHHGDNATGRVAKQQGLQ